MSETILKEVILPEAFNKNGSCFIDCEFDRKYSAQDNFQSSVFFVTAAVKKGNDKVKIKLVVKFQPEDENVRKELRTSVQFYNEIFMYAEILPIINKNNTCEVTFPTFYHGVSTIMDPSKDVIIIEDLRPKGFRLTDEKVFLDIHHLELAMEKLGRFHALSYVAKKENPAKFYNLVGKLKESSWIESETPSWVDYTVRKCFHRAIDPLITSGRHTAVLRRLLTRVDTPNGIVRLMKELVTPEEPAAVLCHGDFCRNNLLYKYSAEVPDDVRFFDVATARYASPAVDIAFFLLMNSTAAVREVHWDRLLVLYHSSLSTAAAEMSRDTIALPSLPTLQQEVRLKAVYGFVHVSFFLPMMLWGDKEMEGFEGATPEEMSDYSASLGGDQGTELLSSMVEELVQRGCLTLDHPFLKDIKY